MQYFLLTFFIFNIRLGFSKDINSAWPEDDSKQFSYPTSDPININPTEVQYLKTPKPLIIDGFPLLLSYATNTGSSLIVTAKKSLSPTTATGGVLYNNTYIFFQREFFWDSSLKRSAGATIDEYGTPLQAVVSFYNFKYGTLKNAMTKRDGIFQVIIFIHVGPIWNPLFYPSELMLPLVKKAGKTILIPEFFNYDFYFLPSLRQDYYAYPGQYYDHASGKTYFSSTVTLWRRFPPPFISFEQFNATFGSFEDVFGKRYSHIASRFPKGSRPVRHVVFSGIELIFKL